MMRLVNRGALPVRVVADARLLQLRLEGPGNEKPVVCTLPAALRVHHDVDNTLVLKPGESYSESIDPAFYCFNHLRKLRAGATVMGTYGFPKAKHRPMGHPPYVVTAVDEPGRTFPDREIYSAITPIEAGAERSYDGPSNQAIDSRAHLELRMPRQMDVSRAVDVSVRVELRNPGSRRATLLFSAETILFDVEGPRGKFTCAWPTKPGAPNRHVYTTMYPHRRRHIHVTLSTPCGPTAFDEAGIYRLRPRLDTTDAPGYSIGLYTYDGEVLDRGAMVLRVRHSRYPTPRPKPVVDSVPSGT